MVTNFSFDYHVSQFFIHKGISSFTLYKIAYIILAYSNENGLGAIKANIAQKSNKRETFLPGEKYIRYQDRTIKKTTN